MNKKTIIIIITIILVILISALLIIKNKRNQNSEGTLEKVKTEGIVKYDEETELYYIRNEATGEIVAASKYEDDLDFYKEHPDYNPDPFAVRTTDLHDFLREDEIEEAN